MNVRRTHGSVAHMLSVIIIPGLSAASVWTASSSAPMAAPASVSAASTLRHYACVCVCVGVRVGVFGDFYKQTTGKLTAALRS